MGIEPTESTMARWRSTLDLRSHWPSRERFQFFREGRAQGQACEALTSVRGWPSTPRLEGYTELHHKKKPRPTGEGGAGDYHPLRTTETGDRWTMRSA